MISISFHAWMIPTVITIICYGYALYIYDDGNGWLSGIGNLLLLIPASAISMLSWIIYAIFK